MVYRTLIRFLVGLSAAGIGILLSPQVNVESRESTAWVEGYRLDSKPDSARLTIQLNRDTPYRILTDTTGQRVVVWVRHARLRPTVQSQSFNNPHLERVRVQEAGNNVKFTIRLKSKSLKLAHFIRHKPEQIVIDVKPKGAALKSLAEKKRSPKKKAPSLKAQSAQKKAPSEKPRSAQKKTPPAPRIDREAQLKSGRKDYEKALKLFQNKNYMEALNAFNQFQQKYRESPYLANVAYLAAEAHYNLTRTDPYPNYENALAAYQYAMRTYPDSKFYDHALFKVATIYKDMNYTLEARTLYEKGILRDKTSRYNDERKLQMGFMFLAEDKLDEAYRIFQIILRKFPDNAEAKKGLFQIGKRYYEARQYTKALTLFENIVRRWPDELKEQPEINFFIGEIYFNQKQYASARRFYFNLVNLAPESSNAHRSLNRIGDTYLLDNKGMAALTVFNKSYNIHAGSAESQYAEIRLADIGIRFPGLPVKDIIFEVSPYYHPYRTYDQVSQHPQSRDILAEATFSRGSAYYREQRYLEAIGQFKRLLPFDPDSKFHQWGKRYVQLSLVQLIDQYAKQNGHLPILYAYADYLTLDLGELNRLQTQLQIGESYKAIGLNSEALKFFEKVKSADINGAYTDRLFLNLAEIHLNENRFPEAEKVVLTFISNYPDSPRLSEAKIILARAYHGQQKYDRSLEIYHQLLNSQKVEIPFIHYMIAETWFAREDMRNASRSYRKTIDTYDRAIRNPPDYVQSAYYKLGMVLYMQGRAAESLDALMAGRKLFPDHRLRVWADYLIVDNLDRLNKKDQAEKELKQMVAENRSDLLHKAGQSHLKVLDWEKRLKELL